MKSFLHWLHSLGAVCLMVAFLPSPANAAEPDRSSPEAVIRNFYQWYVGELLANRDPFAQGRATLRQFATERLLQQIDHMRKGPDGLDGDYFVDAQDFDKDWATNITVSTPIVKDKHATCDVELKGKEAGTRKLLVDLAWQGGRWKVDKVEGEH